MNATRNRLSYRRICKILQNYSTDTHQEKFVGENTCILETDRIVENKLSFGPNSHRSWHLRDESETPWSPRQYREKKQQFYCTGSMLNPLQSAAAGKKTVSHRENGVGKRELGPHLWILRHAGGQAHKPRCAPETVLKRPASSSPSLFSPSLIPSFKENDSWKKKMGLNGIKNPTPPNLNTTGLSRGETRVGKSTFGE
jgi:hypothetical protein